ncbi:MAG: ATP phosphoribosyltransferase [Candidatus Altiarchaeota archaeon]
MIKFYVPDGHLQDQVLDLFRNSGYKVRISERGYAPYIDDEQIMLKRLRPQDFPSLISIGKGDMAITGSDIIEEYRLLNPKAGRNIVELLDLRFGRTKLVVSVSLDAMPKVRTTSDLKKFSKSRQIVVATEYPKMTEDYLRKNRINAIVQRPAGKTEAWIVPPNPEADVVVDTSETGRTLKENNCRIIDVIRETSARLVANRKSLADKKKAIKIKEIVSLFEGSLRAEGMVNVYLNVTNSKNIDRVLKTLNRYVGRPTISDLRGGGYDIFIVIEEGNLRHIIPDLVRNGASAITVSNTRMILG